MAETAKLLNPEKTVLIPTSRPAVRSRIRSPQQDVRLMRQRYPGAPVVAYVNTSAAVKAESDICCTSGNALKVVESLGAERVIMLPDEYLAQNIAAQTDVKIIAWKGHCEVHELFTASTMSGRLRENHPGVTVLAHPECPPEVVAEADFSGSTAAMSGFVGKQRPPRVVLLTECSMSDNVAVLHPDVEFIRPCNLCPHMKRITLKNIRHALETDQHRGHDRSGDRGAGAALPSKGCWRYEHGYFSAGQPAGHHWRRRRRVDDGAAAGAGTGRCCCRKRRSVRKPPACGRRADLAAAMGEDDDPALHLADTLAAGAGLCDEAVASRIVHAAPAAVEHLARLGVAFDRRPDGGWRLGLEAAHSRNRIVHATGDGTGREIMRALIAAVRRCPSITLLEGRRGAQADRRGQCRQRACSP